MGVASNESTFEVIWDLMLTLHNYKEGMHRLTFDIDIASFPIEKLLWKPLRGGGVSSEWRLSRGRLLKAIAYPLHLQLFITSSNRPFKLDHDGIVDFLSMLGEARQILITEFGQPTPLYEVDNPYVIIPEIGNWVWTDRERQIDGATDSRLPRQLRTNDGE